MRVCKKCNVEKEDLFFGTRGKCKDCENSRVREWNRKNKEKRLKSSIKYNKKNQNKVIDFKKKYRKNNRQKINAYNRKYIKERKSTDVLFRLRMSIRKMMYKIFNQKNLKTSQIIGCSFEEFKFHIESKFEIWMNWENKGLYNGEYNYGWDIDHIIPLSSTKDEFELIKLNHYTNLQPLCSKINRDIKKNNVD